jgi:hypothetical protein
MLHAGLDLSRRKVDVCPISDGFVPFERPVFGTSEHGSSHHRSTHRICGWFIRQPPWITVVPAHSFPR